MKCHTMKFHSMTKNCHTMNFHSMKFHSISFHTLFLILFSRTTSHFFLGWLVVNKVLCSSKMRIYSTGKSKQNAQAKCDYILQAKASNRRVELNPTVMRRRPTITITQFSCWFLPSTDPRHQNLYCGSRISKEGNQRNTREIILFCLVLGQR